MIATCGPRRLAGHSAHTIDGQSTTFALLSHLQSVCHSIVSNPDCSFCFTHVSISTASSLGIVSRAKSACCQHLQ